MKICRCRWNTSSNWSVFTPFWWPVRVLWHCPLLTAIVTESSMKFRRDLDGVVSKYFSVLRLCRKRTERCGFAASKIYLCGFGRKTKTPKIYFGTTVVQFDFWHDFHRCTDLILTLYTWELFRKPKGQVCPQLIFALSHCFSQPSTTV